jgi:transposase-like protein
MNFNPSKGVLSSRQVNNPMHVHPRFHAKQCNSAYNHAAGSQRCASALHACKLVGLLRTADAPFFM